MVAKLFASTAVAVSLLGGVAQASFLPPNHLDKEDNFRDANLTEAVFNEVIDEAVAYYEPFFKVNFGATFQVNRLWDDTTVNAYATQYGSTWEVNMFGGLARRSETTRDGFALVLCHEIGHHLGGYPFSSSWAADEGEADYFATLSCARSLWKDQTTTNALARAAIDAYPKSLCDATWKEEADQNLCYRTLLGSKSLAGLLAALEGSKANFNTPDKTTVKTTNHDHPAGQCRLDTYVAGATCVQDFDATAIPGKDLGSKRNTVSGEEASAKYTCQKPDFTVGTRPLCWFKPLL